MLDILGFWTMATILIYALGGIWFIILDNVTAHIAGKITMDEATSRKVTRWFMYESRSNHLKFFGYYEVSAGLVFPFWLLGGVIYMAYGIYRFHGVLLSIDSQVSLLHWVATISEVTAPVMGYIGLFLGVYCGGIILGRKVYKGVQVLQKVVDKVNNE